MIHKLTTFTPDMTQQLGQLWLQGNLQGHPFISKDYWQRHLATVTQQLTQATIYVAQDQTGLQGFIGLQDHYIAGLFVKKAYQHQGIGGALLTTIQAVYPQLTLDVYADNQTAYRFYTQHGFQVSAKGVESATGALDYTMTWTQV